MTGDLSLKPKIECPCLCGTFGMPRKRAWGDGLRHVRGCPCRRCVGSRHSGKAGKRERRIAADLGGSREPLSGGLSGADVRAHMWSFEETSNETVVRGFRRWWTSKTVRTKTARLFARHGEAHGLILSWDGRPQVVVTPYEDFVGQFPNQTGGVA
jgi:hypothetical protein